MFQWLFCFFHLGWTGIRVEQTPGTPPPPEFCRQLRCTRRLSSDGRADPGEKGLFKEAAARGADPALALGTGSRDSQLNFLFVVGFLLFFVVVVFLLLRNYEAKKKFCALGVDGQKFWLIKYGLTY